MKKLILTGAMYLTSLIGLAQEIPEFNEQKYERKARIIEATSRITGNQNKAPYMLFLEDNNFRLDVGALYTSMENVNGLSRKTDKGFDYIQRIPNTDYFVLASSPIQSNAKLEALVLAQQFRGYSNDDLKKIDNDKRNYILTPNELKEYIKK